MRITWMVVCGVLALLPAGTWIHAQATRLEAVPPTVLAGDELGFRMEGRKGGTPVGRLVVRIDGRWVNAELAAGVKLITK